jgi:predicted  nucleic acid-binding Zn-ribbon protein
VNYEKIDRTAASARIAACQGRIAAASAMATLGALTGRTELVNMAESTINEQVAELDKLAQALEDETTTCGRCGWKCSMCRSQNGPSR